MAEFDDARVRSAMRAYLTACDALDGNGHEGDGDASREFIDRADAKSIAEMALRQQLERLGWAAPRAVAPADSSDAS
jgi:hypothetical protein